MDSTRKPPKVLFESTEPSKSVRTKFMGIGHWNRHMQTQEYRSLQPEERQITEDELSDHSSGNSSWMALRNGNQVCVYDVTTFMKYHPGGSEVMMEHLGMDASEAFRCAHSYVSVNMISRCKKGNLVGASRKKPLPNFLSPNMNIAPLIPGLRKLPQKKPIWNWRSDVDGIVTLDVSLHRYLMSPILPSWVAIKQPHQLLLLRVLMDHEYYLFNIRLLSCLTADLDSLRVSFGEDKTLDPGKYVSLMEPKLHINLHYPLAAMENSKPFSTIGSVIEDRVTGLADHSLPDDVDFLTCRVVISQRLSGSKYRHLRLQWPSQEAIVSIPLLHHVFLKVYDSPSVFHTRPYTPVCTDFHELSSNNHFKPGVPSIVNRDEFDLLIKFYSKGKISPIIDKLQVGDTVEVSLPVGNVSPALLTNASNMRLENTVKPWRSVYMVAGGSGITPFLRIIRFLLAWAADEKSTVFDHCRTPWLQLLWFNRTQEELCLVQELDQLAVSQPNRFSIKHVLQSGNVLVSSSPNAVLGQLDQDSCLAALNDATDTTVLSHQSLWLICGPSGFNIEAKKLTQAWSVPSPNVHVLQG